MNSRICIPTEILIQTLKKYSGMLLKFCRYHHGDFVYQGEDYRTCIIATVPRETIDDDSLEVNTGDGYTPEELAGRGLELIYIIDKWTGKTLHSYQLERRAYLPVSTIEGIRDVIVNELPPPDWINE